MSGVLTRREARQMGMAGKDRETQGEPGQGEMQARDGSDAATSQGTPRETEAGRGREQVP